MVQAKHPQKPILKNAHSEVLFVCGATGGHLQPAISVAKSLQERFDIKVKFWIGDRPLEDQLLKGSGLPFEKISGLSTFKRQQLPSWIFKLRKKLKAETPSAVFSFGGQVGFCTALASRGLGIELFLHEQNRVLGQAHQWSRRWARRLFVSFEDSRFPNGKAIRDALISGCPLRSSFDQAQRDGQAHRDNRALRLLVMGGSQGAQQVNLAVAASAKAISQKFPQLEITHICGHGKESDLKKTYDEAGIKVDLLEYVSDPLELMQKSHLVLARSGATTVAELASVGLAAVLVPYPHHKDRQQFLNAQALVDVGAARIAESQVEIQSSLLDLLASKEELIRMGEKARKISWPDASSRIAAIVATHLQRLPDAYPDELAYAKRKSILDR